MSHQGSPYFATKREGIDSPSSLFFRGRSSQEKPTGNTTFFDQGRGRETSVWVLPCALFSGPSRCTAAPSWVTYCSWIAKPRAGQLGNLFPGGVHNYVVPEENEFMVLKGELPFKRWPSKGSRWAPALTMGGAQSQGAPCSGERPCVWLSALSSPFLNS